MSSNQHIRNSDTNHVPLFFEPNIVIYHPIFVEVFNVFSIGFFRWPMYAKATTTKVRHGRTPLLALAIQMTTTGSTPPAVKSFSLRWLDLQPGNVNEHSSIYILKLSIHQQSHIMSTPIKNADTLTFCLHHSFIRGLKSRHLKRLVASCLPDVVERTNDVH